jgi:hypothetical protein
VVGTYAVIIDDREKTNNLSRTGISALCLPTLVALSNILHAFVPRSFANCLIVHWLVVVYDLQSRNLANDVGSSKNVLLGGIVVAHCQMRIFKLCLLAAMIGSASLLQAQDATGRVVGTVTDRSSAVIPGAHVVVTNAATHVSRETITDSSGFYQVLALPIGNYTISVDHKGFNPVTTNSSKLEINQSLKIDIKLEVDTKTETVTVESTANIVETINPTMGSNTDATPITPEPVSVTPTLPPLVCRENEPTLIPATCGVNTIEYVQLWPGSRFCAVAQAAEGVTLKSPEMPKP